MNGPPSSVAGGSSNKEMIAEWRQQFVTDTASGLVLHADFSNSLCVFFVIFKCTPSWPGAILIYGLRHQRLIAKPPAYAISYLPQTPLRA